MKLFFKKDGCEEILIAEPSSKKEVVETIKSYLKENNYQYYYMSLWEEEGRLFVDVGSYTENFFVEGISFEEWTKEKKEFLLQ